MTPVIDHLQQMEEWFNSNARHCGLDVTLDVRRCLPQLSNPGMFFAADMMRAFEYCRVSEEQVSVAVRAITQIVTQPQRLGLIDSKHDEGSTGTAMMMMFACPVGFLTSGVRYAPLYLTTNEHRKLDEAHARVRGFLKLYGEIGIKLTTPSAVSNLQRQDDELDLATYLDGLLDADRYPSGEDFLKEIASASTARRMPGGLARNLDQCQKWAKENAHEPMIILEHMLYKSGRASGAKGSRPSPVARALVEISADIRPEDRRGLVLGVYPGAVAPPSLRSA